MFEQAHSRVIIAAQNKFLEEVSSLRVNLYDMYRTRIETVNMVVNLLKTLGTAYTHLKRGKIKRFCQTLGITYRRPRGRDRSPPGLWLEYSYGWSPLLGDLYTMLENTFEVPHAYVRQVVRFEDSYTNRAWPEYGNLRTFTEGTVKSRATAQGYVYVDCPAILAASQYGLLNPAAVAWEAIPFSFVVDWFAPVGDFLNSLGTTNGLYFKDYSVTSKVTYSGVSFAAYKFSYWDPWEAAGTGQSIIHNRFDKRRQLNNNPTYLWPGVKSPLDQSLTRYSYALSLFASIFSSRR